MSSNSDLPQVDDPGQLNQRIRVQSINESRQNVIDTYRELPYLDDLSDAERVKALQTAVTGFLTDIVYLIQKHGSDEYGTVPLGEVTIPCPDEYADVFHSHPKALKTISDPPESKQYNIQGIYTPRDHSHNEQTVSYLDAPQDFTASWTVRIRERHSSQPQPRDVTVSRPMPIDVSLQAFRLGVEFLADHGLDARIGEQDHDPNPY